MSHNRKLSHLPRPAQLEDDSICLSRRNRWKTGNRVEQLGNERVMVKDCAILPGWYRVLIGMHQLRREYAILKELNGFPHTPSVLGWVSPYAFAMQWIEGTPLNRIENGARVSVACERLYQSVRTMHERGVAHCDLHRRNILVSPSGHPWLVDFATAVQRSKVPQWIWLHAQHLDWVAVGKILRKYHPALFREAGAPWHQPPPFGYRALRTFLHRFRRRSRE